MKITPYTIIRLYLVLNAADTCTRDRETNSKFSKGPGANTNAAGDAAAQYMIFLPHRANHTQLAGP